jgi:hypothetical protein
MSNATFIIGSTGGQINFSKVTTPDTPPSGYVGLYAIGNTILTIDSNGNEIPFAAGATGAAGSSGTSGVNGANGSSGTSGSVGATGSSGTSGVNGANGSSGTSGSVGPAGSSGTSGVNGSVGATGPAGLGLTTKNIGVTGGQFVYDDPNDIVYFDWTFTQPFNTTNYSIDFQFQSLSIAGNDSWYDLSVSGVNNITITNKTTNGVRIQFEGINSPGPVTSDLVGYIQAIATGETSVPGQDGSSGSSGTSGAVGAAGSSGTSGVNGSSGTSGVNGSSGTSGDVGAAGSSGTSGVDGSNGTSGVNGATGAAGSAGTSGTSFSSPYSGNLNGTAGQSWMSAFGSTTAIDWNNGNVQTHTLTTSTTFTFANPQNGATYIVLVRQAAAGNYTVTWPTVSWSGATTPTMTATANRYDVYTFIYANNQYYGSAVQNFT